MPIPPTSENGEAMIVSAPVAARYAPDVPNSRIRATVGKEKFFKASAINSEATGVPPSESMRTITPKISGSCSASRRNAKTSSALVFGPVISSSVVVEP